MQVFDVASGGVEVVSGDEGGPVEVVKSTPVGAEPFGDPGVAAECDVTTKEDEQKPLPRRSCPACEPSRLPHQLMRSLECRVRDPGVTSASRRRHHYEGALPSTHHQKSAVEG